MGHAQAARHYVTEEEYYAFCDDHPDGKYEYYQGEIFAMAGAMPNHNLIAMNIGAAIHPQAKKKGCRTLTSDQRVLIEKTGLKTFPDITVVCGPLNIAPSRRDTITNPALLVEVLSQKTEAYDRDAKFEHYKKIPTLMEYLMVSSEECFVELYARQADDSWAGTSYPENGQTIVFPHSGFTLTLEEVYDDVGLPIVHRKPGRPAIDNTP